VALFAGATGFEIYDRIAADAPVSSGRVAGWCWSWASEAWITSGVCSAAGAMSRLCRTWRGIPEGDRGANPHF